jgi:hypothetical protein
VLACALANAGQKPVKLGQLLKWLRCRSSTRARFDAFLTGVLDQEHKKINGGGN